MHSVLLSGIKTLLLVRYFKLIFEKSGSAAMEKKFGDWFSYDKTPRALIFARNQSQIENLDHMIKLMR